MLPDYLGELAKRVKEITEARPVSKDRELKRHVAMLRHLVASYKARDWQLQLDGEDLSGRYILVEAMNIRAVGPVLKLAPHAKTNDGYLDFVAVHNSERDALCDYLEARLRHEEVAFPFRSRRFRHLQILRGGAPLHFDDKLWPTKKDKTPAESVIEITVEPAALTIRLPKRAGRRRTPNAPS